ncbi:cation-transporting P-type ATPase [Acuticoccus sp. M5D2P5]|uniref:cation-translocating P-type ATPase n=1 Tax=Acuticoccus kalidii TaxID=2910977 RepID=UPI001F2E51C5|nr:cation-transporting P-type ATPase [Acuticoccus kalidii]MCF3934871.1 cation-transporting P-type ATPase [Acuticoccus kalidii]
MDEIARRPATFVRHHLPGRTRFALAAWPGASAVSILAATLGAHGITLRSAHAATRSILLTHSPSQSAGEVAARLDAALSDLSAGCGPAPPAGHGVSVEVAARLDVSGALAALESASEGLDEGEVRRRRAAEGANACPAPRGRSRGDILFEQIATLPMALLAGSAVLSIATGGIIDALVTIGAIALNTGIGFTSENATEALIRRMSKPVDHGARVVRGGAVRQCPAHEIVRGDVVVLAPGVLVPADARVIDARDLTVDESVLTGESVPAAKSPMRTAITAPIAERANIVHAGTVVTGGDGRAVVFGVGTNTDLARMRALIGAATPPRPPLEIKLASLSTVLTLGSLTICGAVLGVGLLRREPVALLLKSVAALAVSAIPEGLPAVATSVLALGARAMEKDRAYVRALPAVEAIGSIDTIAFDKTGTLTENRMAVVYAATAGRLWETGGAEAWSATSNAELVALAEAVSLCNEASLSRGTGSSTETALLRFADAVGVDHHRMRDAAPVTASRARNHLRRWMATEHRRGEGAEIAVKGAPDELSALSTAELSEAGVRPLDEARRQEIMAVNLTLARRGLRVLGVARRGGAMGDGAIGDLVFLGLVALADPIRPEAHTAIDLFHRAGVRTVMITGDQPATALAVAQALSLSRTGVLTVVEGAEIARLDEAALGRLARGTSVFARVGPGDKLRIVRALQREGRSVAMIGDGVNDGPALRAAAVGVAIGQKSTDTAREVADIVIAGDLVGLGRAIGRGRTAEDNVRAAIRYLVSTNLSELMVMLVESLHGRGEMETAMELLWLNLVTDTMPAFGLALAEARGDVMLRPPRQAAAPLFERTETGTIMLDAAGLAVSALAAHFTMMARSGTGPRARTVTFLTLALGQIVHGLVLRDRSRNDGVAARLSQRRLVAMLGAAAGILAVPFVARGFGRALGIGRLRAREAAVAALFTALAFAVAEARHARVGSAATADAGGGRSSPPVRAA